MKSQFEQDTLQQKIARGKNTGDDINGSKTCFVFSLHGVTYLSVTRGTKQAHADKDYFGLP
jgi:hypothetical protein